MSNGNCNFVDFGPVALPVNLRASVSAATHDKNSCDALKIRCLTTHPFSPQLLLANTPILKRKGCLICRKRKVKCGEEKPSCSRCQQLGVECSWDDMVLHLRWHSGQIFALKVNGITLQTIGYLQHFATVCTRFIAYPWDSEMNPFLELVPLTASSPALLHSMAALAASHLSRSQQQHNTPATRNYSIALLQLSRILSDPKLAGSDSTLAACLILCVYEITHSKTPLWLIHLKGARDLLLYQGGPKPQSCLTRFFSLLDISASLASSSDMLIQGNYWLETEPTKVLRWPYYDDDNIITRHFHQLMVYMAKLSKLSAESMGHNSLAHPRTIADKGSEIEEELQAWWSNCLPIIRDQRTDWRRIPRERILTVSETLQKESFSRFQVYITGCFLYLYHILNPVGRDPQRPEAIKAIATTLEVAREIPEGYGLQIHWGLFMAGVSIFNDSVAEDFIRLKLEADGTISIHHARRALDLLEELWKTQHQYKTKHDWRVVQKQMGIQAFIFV